MVEHYSIDCRGNRETHMGKYVNSTVSMSEVTMGNQK